MPRGRNPVRLCAGSANQPAQKKESSESHFADGQQGQYPSQSHLRLHLKDNRHNSAEPLVDPDLSNTVNQVRRTDRNTSTIVVVEERP